MFSWLQETVGTARNVDIMGQKQLQVCLGLHVYSWCKIEELWRIR